MKLSVSRSSAYNLASETRRSLCREEDEEDEEEGLGNTSLYDHCPQCRVLATRPHRDIYRPASFRSSFSGPKRSAISSGFAESFSLPSCQLFTGNERAFSEETIEIFQVTI